MQRLIAILMLTVSLLAGADDASFRADVEALTATPHRITGSPEIAAAGDHVLQRLNEIGVTQVFQQNFRLPVLKQERCEMIAGDRTIPLQSMRPNNIIPPSTAKDGVTGRLIDVGMGRLEDYPDNFRAGDIVVMDFNSHDNWRWAFRLGAAAVVFQSQPDMGAVHEHSSTAPANLPRFFHEGERASLPFGETVTLHATIKWEQGEGRNIVALIQGTDPDMAANEAQEALILSAPLDSFGEVPWRSPAATDAANVAGLLQVAEHLTANPPMRNTILLFTDADAWGHNGAMHFYRLVDEQKKIKAENARLEKRIETRKTEQEFVEVLLKHMAEAYPPAGHSESNVMTNALQRIAASRSYAYDLKLKVARIGQGRGEEPSDEVKRLVAEKSQWTQVRRHLGKREKDWPTDPVVRGLLEEVMAQYKLNIEARKAELDRLAEMQAQEQEIFDAINSMKVVLHISMMVGDKSDRWGLVIGDGSRFLSQFDQPGLYTRVQTQFKAAVDAVEAEEPGSAHAEIGSMDLSMSQQDAILATGTYTHAGSIAGLISIYNVALGTVQEDFDSKGTPSDTLEALNVDAVSTQIAGISKSLRKLGDDENLSIARSIRYWNDYMAPAFEQNQLRGVSVLSVSSGASIPDLPTSDVVVSIIGRLQPPQLAAKREIKIPGFNNFLLIGTDRSGTLASGPAMEAPNRKYAGFAATFDDDGRVEQAVAGANENGFYTLVNVYKVDHGALVLPPSLDGTVAPKVMDGPSNGVLQDKKSISATNDGITFWYVEPKVDQVKLFANAGMSTLGIFGSSDELDGDGETDNQTEVIPGTGTGIPASGRLGQDVTSRAASDLWTLDEERLSVLRKKGIMNGSLEELHGRAEDLQIAASEAETVAEAQAAYAASLALQQRTYGPIRQMMDDLVKAVLILLALCVPFAFSLERLLIGTPSIYKQISWFVFFFVITFLLLYVSHPAFAISKTPIIIFLGFTIVVLSAMVIVIIMQKFETELKILQGMESTVHAADVSRLSTVLAAMSMGISSMRRRPLRTALTAVTIILLTFTILGFASFGSQKAVLTFYLQPAQEYPGVYVHQLTWSELPQEMVDVMRHKWGQETEMTTRRWISPTDTGSDRVIVAHPDGSSMQVLTALLGMDEAELEYRADLKKMLGSPAPFAESVWMTESTAARAGVKPGDQVLVNGKLLTVGNLLNPVTLISRYDMDDSTVLPVDFQQASSSSTTAPEDLEAMAMGGDQSWQPVAPDATLIVGNETARALGAQIRAVCFYPTSISAATTLAEDIARILPLPVVGSRADGVYRHILGSALAASGLKSLIFPILLGGLVIFGTMLGSVADREKEIYTFSALGLAPPHVAGLFFAEALIYSVIGGLGGYLLAQGSMKVLEIFAELGLVRVPEMNYSSTNAIVTILLVMATVMVSAIYPAIKASRSANPGVLRSWSIPEPDGDTLDMTFPFTVSEYDITGVVSFLQEHFDTFSDVGLGVFMTMDSKLIKTESGNLGLEADIALAPFDLGVTQTFRLTSAPSEIEGIDEVAITIIRRSGQPKDWQRQNKVLLDDLRRQFLLWRALPPETMEMYRLRTMQQMSDA